MELDKLTQLADAQAVTDTDAYTTYSYDLGSTSPQREVGAGTQLALMFTVDVAAAGSTDTTDLQLVTSANATLASHVDLASWRIANASLTAGAKIIIPIPPAPGICLRYIGGRIELGSGDTITVSANIIPIANAEVLQSYPDAITYDA